MKRIVLLFCFYIMPLIIYSQELIIDEGVVLKKGIYKTYEEFKNNAPSIPLEWDIQSGIFNYSIAGSNTGGVTTQMAYNDTVFKLTIEKPATKEIGTVWGFCDGRNTYINREFSLTSGKVIFKPDSKFFKILYLGRYCYFGSAYPSGPNNNYIHLNCAIEFNSGELIEVNKKQVKKIISNDEELLIEYNNEKFWDSRSDSICFQFLKRYSEKHENEIKSK
jgi:hypothetical protein